MAAPTRPARATNDDATSSNRVAARIAFVVTFASIGLLVGLFVASRITTSYRTTTLVELPEGADPATFVDDALAVGLTGDDGQRLSVEPDGDDLRFIAEATSPDVAAATANQSANAFISAQNDAEIRVVEPATVPTSPASPGAGPLALIGAGVGALVGLVLQSALRPQRRADGVTYLPTWTSEVAATPGTTSAVAEPMVPPTSIRPDSPDGRERGSTEPADSTIEHDLLEPIEPDGFTSSFDAAGPVGDASAGANVASAVRDSEPSGGVGVFDEPFFPVDDEPDTADATVDEPDDATLDQPDDTHDRPTGDDTTSADSETAFDSDDDETAPTATPADGDPMSDESDTNPDETIDLSDAPQGLQNLLARTGANIDPLVDRFAEDDDDLFADELHEVWKQSSKGAFQASVEIAAPAGNGDLDTLSDDTTSADAPPMPDAGADHLVEQVTFLTSELTKYQQMLGQQRNEASTTRDELIASHHRELEDLAEQLRGAHDDRERLERQRDSARAVLEDRIGELEIELGSRDREIERLRNEQAAEAGRQRVHEDDLATENEFLRREVERYQRTIDEERVAHATAVATAQVENQDEVDRIHREHRVTLNQLAHTNRNLLATQRNDADLAMTALEADHQRQLEEAHNDYERRVQKLKAHFEDKLASSERRVEEQLGASRDAELTAIRRELGDRRADGERLEKRLEESEAAREDLERQRAQQRLDLEQAERAHVEERRRLAHRARSLEEQLARAETRLAEERRRTSDVVRNLLEDSASSVAQAEQARLHEVDGRAALEARHRQELDAITAEARALEQAAAQREAMLEATIAELRRGTQG